MNKPTPEKKPVIEWLETLGHPYRKQAIENCLVQNQFKYVTAKSDAVENAFIWSDSPQGWEYWNAYWNYLCDKELNAIRRARPETQNKKPQAKTKFYETLDEPFKSFHKTIEKFEKKMGWKSVFYAMIRYQKEMHKDDGYNFGDAGK